MPTPLLETLYHSFPRRFSGGEGVQKGLLILELILKHGLVLTPEVVKWQVSFNPNPTYVAQKRVCFTSLSTEDLADHAETFGPISIGFERVQLETIGATPVFYIPRSLMSTDVGRNIGSFYIERLLQIQMFLDNNPKSFRIGGENLQTSDLSNFTRFLTGLFYPVEEVRGDQARMYFSQREWRVLANLYRGNVALTELLEDGAKTEISSIDPDFFERRIIMARGPTRRIDQCALISTIAGKPLRESITTIVAPRTARDDVDQLLKAYRVSPQLICQ